MERSLKFGLPAVLIAALVLGITSVFYATIPMPEVNFSFGEPGTYATGQMMDTLVGFELTKATKEVGGAYAYWEANGSGDSCFFGIDSGVFTAANALPGPCPSNPDDQARIAELIQQLWDSLKTQVVGRSWAELLALGGKATAHVTAIIELAKAYGVTLVP